MNAAIAKLSAIAAASARGGAVLVVAIVVALARLLLPLVLLHRHYDDTIAALTDRLERYRRVAAQAPEYRKALEAMREKDARRFFLKNTAPNLAGAELQELVRAAIESNGGRITTSQNQVPRDEGRFRQIGVSVQFFASTPALQKILYALEASPPYLLVEKHDAAAAQRVSRLQAAARPGAGSQRPARCGGLRVCRAGQEVNGTRPQEDTPMNKLSTPLQSALWWLLPLVALAAIVRLGNRIGARAVRDAARKPRRRSHAQAGGHGAAARIRNTGRCGRVARKPSSARCSIHTRRPASQAAQERQGSRR